MASLSFKNGIWANMAYMRTAISGDIVHPQRSPESFPAIPAIPPITRVTPYIQICCFSNVSLVIFIG